MASSALLTQIIRKDDKKDGIKPFEHANGVVAQMLAHLTRLDGQHPVEEMLYKGFCTATCSSQSHNQLSGNVTTAYQIGFDTSGLLTTHNVF